MTSSATDSRSSEALKGKLALITGCTGGIGHATALRLAGVGCSIAVHYNSAQSIAVELAAKLRGLGVRAASFQADLSSYDGVRALHAAVVSSLGNPDILFNNAGVTTKVIGADGNIEDISPEAFEMTWRTNTGTHYLLTQLCIPHMVSQKFGRIIFCSSVAAGTGGVIGPHYASSKSAMHGLVHWIASRYAKDGLTCNAVAPALITETTMFANPKEELRARIPVGRFGVPDEIASVIELLITNAYLTNKIIVADGGWTPSAF
ncbi:NAD-binding protein [Fomitiporia mediterranea MF3/22]|uniref:NAD-binding protein n=1 Tax=Fomitiporia mediterranea (strain MF3/22) TaxID=694068 RepID=UPI00044073EA|nr:NAD-binding protein [Fomitiporia mediterranea MF3/22]EJD01003.1 NAD-binding protein [Fomitiporia mediterranea MF3/22]